MSHAVESLVRHCFRGESGRQRDVALAIADGCPDHTGERMFKAISTIAHLADVGHSTAERAISHFVKVGWLIKVRGGGYGPRSTTEYKINPVWMELAGQEIAAAYAERRLSRRVPIDLREAAVDADANKHPNLGCLDQEISTPVEAPKHPNFEAKYPKNGPKHPSSWGTNYEHRTNTLNNNPLPPKGGERENLNETGEGLQKPKADKPRSLLGELVATHPCAEKALLAELIAIHPKHETADTANASRALAQYAANALAPLAKEGCDADPDAWLSAWNAMAQELAAALQSDAKSLRWQGDASRYAPKLSKWLRGKRAMLKLPQHVRPVPASQGREAIEAQAKALGLGSFEQWQVGEYGRTGCLQSWAGFRKAVESKRGVSA